MSSLFGGASSTTNKTSLFGSQPPVATTTPSVFGTSQQAGVFGGTNQPQQQTGGGSLFGSLKTGSQQQPAQAPTSGLFGSNPTLGIQTQTQSQPLGQPSNGIASQPQLNESLFNTLGSNSQNPNSKPPFQSLSSIGGQSLPNESGQDQRHPQHSGAYFDSLLEKSRKRAHGETAFEDLPTLQFGLGDLRQRIKKLGTSTRDRTTDGRAHYLLAGSGADAGAAVSDLNYFETQAARGEPIPSTSNVDVDVESYLENLQIQTTLGMIADGLARSARGFDMFLEENYAMESDSQRKRIYEHFGINYPRKSEENRTVGESASRGGFGRSRRSRVQARSVESAVASKTTVLGSTLHRSVIGTPGPVGPLRQLAFADVSEEGTGSLNGIGDDRFARGRQERFAETVQALNLSRLGKHNFPLFTEFSSVEGQSGDQHVKYVMSAYSAMIEMTGENSNPQEPQVKERQFSDAYLSEEQSLSKGLDMRRMILAGANRHFEKRFFGDLGELISKNPREANMGGIPDVISKVKAYIRLRASRKDLVEEPYTDVLQIVDDDYIWAIIFYLLRSGHNSEAAKYVKNNQAAFRAIDRNFATYITSYSKSADRRLPRELQDRINNEYNQRVRVAPEHSIDPFRMACYKIIGRCEIEKRNLEGLKQGLEDWVWLQLNLAREVDRLDEVASQAYGLADVQKTIKDIGARHFSKGGVNQSVGVYFYLQILSGLFEDAVKYLYTFHYIDAVHFAIALDYYGLLRVSDPSSPSADLLTYSIRGSPQINFAQMIGRYTRDFRAAKPVIAVDYLSLICLNSDVSGPSGQQQANQCHEALRELVLETREFAQLLGDVQANGQRVKGAIEDRIDILKLADSAEFMQIVTIQAASVADDNGRVIDAILLYHLAGEYNNVVTIINRAEGDYIASEIGSEPAPIVDLSFLDQPNPHVKDNLSLASLDHPHILAKYVVELYLSNQMYHSKIDKNNGWVVGTLLRVANTKGFIQSGEWGQALDTISRAGILPLTANGEVGTIRRASSLYSSYPQSILRNIGQMLLWTIFCCSKERERLLSSQFSANDGTRSQLVEDLKQKAQDLMMYAGFLRYRLPPSVNDTIARIASE